MQRGYRYALTRAAGPRLRSRIPARTDARGNAAARRVLRQIHDRLPQGISARAGLPAPSLPARQRDCTLNYFGVDASQPLSVWRKKGWIYSRRSARLVSMVLPLLYGPAHSRRRRAADQALESDPPPCAADRAQLRTGRCHLPAAAAPGAAALGLRQPEDLRRGSRPFALMTLFAAGVVRNAIKARPASRMARVRPELRAVNRR